MFAKLTNSIFLVSALAFLLIALPSCKTTKIGKAKGKKTLMMVEDQMQKQEFDADWFAGKIKVKFWEDDNKATTFNLDVRMRKDSVIWLSAYPALGMKIEVGRALITPNSIEVMDKFNRQYYQEDFDYIRNYIEYPLDFQTLQALIYGQAIHSGNFTEIESVGEQYRISSEDCTLFLNSNDFNLIQMLVEEKNSDRSIVANFEEYQTFEENSFSNKRNYLMKAEKNYAFNLQFSKIKVNQPMTFPFKVTSKYKKVE